MFAFENGAILSVLFHQCRPDPFHFAAYDSRNRVIVKEKCLLVEKVMLVNILKEPFQTPVFFCGRKSLGVDI